MTMPSWGLSTGRVLIVDDDDGFRGALVKQIQSAGGAAAGAESYEEALGLVERHPEIRVVILDHPTVGSDVGLIVEALRRLRPELAIVGNSGADRRAEFADAGVTRYLQKPWRLADLVALLSGRYESCVGCGSPLPLRRPGPGENGCSWICVSCGARYRAVFDETAPEPWRGYALPAEAMGGSGRRLSEAGEE
jgi:CheY-like chemotaxis protein